VANSFALADVAMALMVVGTSVRPPESGQYLTRSTSRSTLHVFKQVRLSREFEDPAPVAAGAASRLNTNRRHKRRNLLITYQKVHAEAAGSAQWPERWPTGLRFGGLTQEMTQVSAGLPRIVVDCGGRSGRI
jgi:hypothetical protein